MFTGIIEEVGIIKGVSTSCLTIRAEKVLKDIKPGDSIAANGVCLTVSSANSDTFSADIMPETLRRTNLGKLHYGDLVNLERAIVVGSRLGGHLVQGHVDGTGRVLSLVPEGAAIIARISASRELMLYIVEKGFISVDGVSLTATDCDAVSLTVSLVTYTREHTTLGNKKPGDVVNLEVDIIAKYIERHLRSGNRSLTVDFLKEHGFVNVR